MSRRCRAIRASSEAIGCRVERRARNVECDVVHRAYLSRRRSRGILPFLIREHCEEASVTGVEVKMVFLRVAEVWLFEDEGHSKHALPEIDCALFR